MQLWSEVFKDVEHVVIEAGQEVLLDCHPGATKSLTIDGSLFVRQGYWLDGIQRTGSGCILPENNGAAVTSIDNQRVIQMHEFIDRIPVQVLAGIMAAAQQSPLIAALKEKLLSRPTVNLDSPLLIGGLAEMVKAGLMSDDLVAQLRH